MGYFVLEGCRIDEGYLTDFFAAHLSENLEDYPEGIVIPVDKPLRWTSADAVRKVKFQLHRHFHQKKIKVGHAGTLDPMATGLLLICVGKATKISERLQAHDKEYEACIEFGATTTSFDLEQPVESFFPYRHITREALENAVRGFIGEQEQVPPIFSAKYVGGERAYEYARAGEAVELSKAVITIHSIDIEEFSAEGCISNSESLAAAQLSEPRTVRHTHNYHTASTSGDNGRPRAVLRIRCSKGTYIRSLARDLGAALGSGAYLVSLRRTASGDFRLPRTGDCR